VLSQLPDFARNDITVMLSGEIGLSKELSQAMVTGVQCGARSAHAHARAAATVDRAP